MNTPTRTRARTLRRVPPARALREHPDLNQLRRQAKELLGGFRSGNPVAVAEITAHYRRADPATFALHDAQLVLARSYGFESRPKLKARVVGGTVADLVDAVCHGDIAQVRALLKVRPELANTDVAYDDEHCALHYAVLGRSVEMVRLLMEHGADPRKGIWPHRDATSPLQFAIDRGYDDIVTVLRDEEQRRPRHPSTGHRPGSTRAGETLDDGGQRENDKSVRNAEAPARAQLADAFQRRDEEGALAILQADPTAAEVLGRPLHAAAAMLWERVAVWLLEHGYDVNWRGESGWTALEIVAGAWRDAYPLDRLVRMADLLRSRGAELTPRAAVALGEADWLRARHAEGALANPPLLNPSYYYGGLLMTAVAHDRLDMLKLLLDLGFDPDERVRVGGLDDVVYAWGLPLQQCARLGKFAAAEMLLDRGADPNPQTYIGQPPMSFAYEREDTAMIELLERYGGKLHPVAIGLAGRTALARKLFEDEAAGRLAAGAILPDRWGETLAELFLWSGAAGGHPEIVRIGIERMTWPRDDPRWWWMLWHALYAGEAQWEGRGLACFRQVLKRCDPNVSLFFKRTILHDVIAAGANAPAEARLAFATAVLDAGARLDIRDELLASTPLGWACRWGLDRNCQGAAAARRRSRGGRR